MATYGHVTTLYGHHTRNVSFLAVPSNIYGAESNLTRALFPTLSHILDDARTAQVIPEQVHATIQVVYRAFVKCPCKDGVWLQLSANWHLANYTPTISIGQSSGFGGRCCELNVLCVLLCKGRLVALAA